MSSPTPHILAIEISNPGAGAGTSSDGVQSGPSVALGKTTGDHMEVVGIEWLRVPSPGQRGGIDDDLMPALDRLFARAGAPARELLRGGRVAVSIGPGGYTSLRIACAAGKMIAEVCGAACVSVPTAAALACTARRAGGREASVGEGSRGPLAVALAGKGEISWVQMFNEQNHASPVPGRLISAADIAALHGAGLRTLIADQHLHNSIRSEAQRRGIAIVEPVYDARAVLELAAELPTCDPVELNPLYPREPDAVTLWRNRKRA